MESDIRMTGLRTRAVNVPLQYPVITAVGVVATAPLVLIDLETDSGVVGHAYVFTYTPLALKATQAMIDALAPLVAGQPLSPHTIEQLLQARFRLVGNTGLIRMASAGLDMAIWDAYAKTLNAPLVEVLGGRARPIPAYDSHSMDGVDLAVRRAHDASDAGYRAIKTKIGYASLAQDLDVIRAIRHAVGDHVEILVDYNQGLSVPEAIQRSRALASEGLGWIEEPTLQHDYDGHRKIREAIATPVQMGENWFGVEEMSLALKAQACDLCMPDLMKIGGVSGWLRARTLAECHGLPMSSHIFQEFSAHLLAVTPTCHWLERMDLAGPVVDSSLTFRDGHAHIGDRPGAGFVWKEDAVERYSV
ncbi:racemase [Pandoraea capi]|uniref:Racemase n=2 Tax=Pandoraea capi TaxID=2508286 RepID=A0ABY6W4V0_9BURK|nr:racemase [Pandoraea capi]